MGVLRPISSDIVPSVAHVIRCVSSCVAYQVEEAGDSTIDDGDSDSAAPLLHAANPPPISSCKSCDLISIRTDDAALNSQLQAAGKLPAQSSSLVTTLAPDASTATLLACVGPTVGTTKRRVPLLCNPRLWQLLPLILYTGLESAFISGDFTLYVVRPALGMAWIGGFMSIYGLSNAITCVVAAQISHDLWTMIVLLATGALCQVAVLLILLLVSQPSFWLVLVFAVLWGVGDAVFMSQINAVIPIVLPDDADAAFAQWKMWSSGASCAMYIASPLFPMVHKAWFLVGTCALSLPLIMLLR